MGDGRFIAGDPLRGAAALWVVTYHIAANAMGRVANDARAVDLGAALGEVGHFLSRAIIGVYLFFGLSAFLLARPFVRSIVLGGRFPRLSSYARNRALRIIPVFWIAVVATFIVFGRRGEGWSEVLVVPLMAQMYDPSNFSRAMPHAWTLDVELLFYILLPAAAWGGLKLIGGRWDEHRRALAVLAVLVASGIGSILVRTSADEWFEIIWLPGIWFSFAAGAAVAGAEPLLRDRITRPETGRRVATAVMAFAVGTLVYFVWGADSLLAGGLAAFVFVFAVLLAPLLLQWTTGNCWKLLDNRPLHWIGLRSYSFYIWHVLVLHFVAKPMPEFEGRPGRTMAVLLVPGLVACLAVTWASYKYIEEPFLRRRHLWRRNEPAPSPAAVSVG